MTIKVEIQFMQFIKTLKSITYSCVFLVLALGVMSVSGNSFVNSAQAAVVSNIDVRGNQRIDDEVVASYLTISPGQNFSNFDIDDSIKALFATGLFSDVSIYQQGASLVVEIAENSTVNKVFFEGNKRLKEDALKGVTRLKSQSVYSDEQVASDIEQIKLAYSRVGRRNADVSYELVPLANNRMNVIYRIDESSKTKIENIIFVGNTTFPEHRLHDVIATKESNFLSFLTTSDVYDRHRISSDEERLRQFYINKGFADFEILSTDAQLDEELNEYIITFNLEEGPRYTFGNIQIESSIAEVDATQLQDQLETFSGEYYNARKVEKTIQQITEVVAERGHAFVEVAPRGSRDFDNNTIDVTYLVDEGARVYIDDIHIVGNDRTRDYVIRREFELSEGDAYNKVLINKTRDRIRGLGFFEDVTLSTQPGSQPDRVIVIVNVVEKSTGDISLSGGYSTNGGASGEISFTERNFLGRGQYFKVAAKASEDESSYSFNFSEPYFLGYRMSAGIALQTTQSDEQSERLYKTDTNAGTLTFGIPITEHLGTSVFYTYRDTDVSVDDSRIDALSGVGDGTQGNNSSEMSSALVGGLGEFTFSGFGYSLSYNTLDNQKQPREGMRATFTQTFYGAGGDAQYVSTEGKIIQYATLVEDEDIVGFLRARGGHVEVYGDDDGTKFRTFDNYQARSSSIRGFDSYGYGPRDPLTNDPLGGRTFWNATAEVQFPLPFISRSLGLRGAFFADGGQLLNVGDNALNAFRAANPGVDTAELEDDTFRASVGASVLWDSPFGPLRVDYAFPIEKQDSDDLQEFNFGISRDF